MIKILVDTDIIIDFLRTGQGIFPSLFDFQQKRTVELYISTITILELFSGSSSKKDQDPSRLISTMKVVEFNTDVAKFAGELKRDNAIVIAFADLIIGSSALYINAKILTKNKKHFRLIPGLKFYSN